MQTLRQLDALRAGVAALRAEGGRIALVPTMGALHAGHLALVEEAKRAADHVVASIFVNPTQFAPGEDFDQYPRREATDSRMLADADVAILWIPPVEVMYPRCHASRIVVSGVSDVLDGAHRPGHFDGVATIVAKLLNQIRPDVALFGDKDFQQLAVIRRMVADLDIDTVIQGVTTQRDDDGLALSSRNIYLDDDERSRAVTLPRALGVAAQAIERGDDVEAALQGARSALTTAGFAIDYVELVDADTLGAHDPALPGRLLVAARMGTTRLIDNVPVAPVEQG